MLRRIAAALEKRIEIRFLPSCKWQHAQRSPLSNHLPFSGSVIAEASWGDQLWGQESTDVQFTLNFELLDSFAERGSRDP